MRRILLFLLGLLVLSGCSQKEPGTVVDIFYVVDTQTAQFSDCVIAQEIEIPQMELTKTCQYLIGRLCKENPQIGSVPAFSYPAGVESVAVKSRIAYVTFNAAYAELPLTSRIRAETAVTMTLCALDDIDAVSLSVVDGEETMYTSESFVVGLEPFRLMDWSARLYFPNAEETGLFAEHRTIRVTGEEAVAAEIVKELIRGYQNAEGQTVTFVAPGTQLLSANVREGICYVNLTKEFLYLPRTNQDGYQLTLYAVVNSLAELSGVDAVQFLIESRIIDAHMHDGFTEPIYPVYELTEN